MRRRHPGRPRLTAEEVQARAAEYCTRYGVAPNEDGLPPFPSGRRETEQHREWMALYKALRRLVPSPPGSGANGPSPTAERAECLEQLRSQGGRCSICAKPLEAVDARLDRLAADSGARAGVHGHETVAMHARCQQLVDLARELGRDALDRARARL